MPRSFFQSLQIGALLASSAGAQQPAGTVAAPTPASPDAKPAPTAQIQDSIQLKKAARLMDRALHGSHSLLDIITRPEFAKVQEHIGLDVGSLTPDILKSSIVRQAIQTIRLRDYISDDGTLTESLIDEKVKVLCTQTLGKMTGTHLTLEQAMSQDPMLAQHITDQISGLSLTSEVHPAMRYFARNTEVKSVYSSNGKITRPLVEMHQANALWHVPLGDLARPDLQGIQSLLRTAAEAEADQDKDMVRMMLDDLRDNNPPFFDLPNSTVTIGDILFGKGARLRIDPSKAERVSSILLQEGRTFAKEHALGAASQGRSVYDYLTNPQDSSRGAVVNTLFEGNTLIEGIRADAHIPDAVRSHLQRVPLSAVLTVDGGIDDTKLRDAMIEPVKHRTLAHMGEGFVQLVMGSEVAAIVDDPYRNNRSDPANLIDTAMKIEMGLFQSGGNPGAFEATRKNVERGVYPAERRTADVIRPQRVPGPWPQFEQQDGTTSIPYSFNIADNAILPHPDVHQPRALTPRELDVADYTLWRTGIGVKLQFKQVDTLPVMPALKDGTPMPQGMLFYNADLSRIKVYGGDVAAAGVAVGALKAPSHDRVDSVLDNNYSFGISTRIHELGHGLGLSHDFDPRVTPALIGTENKPGNRSTPGINENITVMAYKGAMAPNDQYYEQLTPMLGDALALQKQFGEKPANPGNTTYTLHEGITLDAVRDRDTTKIWVGTNRPFAQNIVDTGGVNTLDISNVSGKPADLVGTLDLNRSANTLDLRRADGSKYTPTYVSALGTFQNAIIGGNGAVKGTVGDNVLEAKTGGTLDGWDGNDTLVGGVGCTTFVGGAGRDRIIVRSDPRYANYEDSFRDYHPREDKIIAPAGTVAVEYETRTTSVQVDQEGKPIPSSGPETLIRFLDKNGEGLKWMSVTAADKSALAAADLHIESTDGKPIPLHEIKNEDELARASASTPPSALDKTKALIQSAGGLASVNQVDTSAARSTSARSTASSPVK